MATGAYMKVIGQNQGAISDRAFSAESVGSTIFQEAHQDSIYVLASGMEVAVPTDPQSGQPTGVRSHRPFTVTKFFDRASPLLWQAACTGEVLQVSLDFYRTSARGGMEHYFTMKFTDAVIVDMKGYFENILKPEFSQMGHHEDVSFVYRAVEWTHQIAGTTGSDDWRRPATR